MPMFSQSYRFAHGAPTRDAFLHDVTHAFGPSTDRALEDVHSSGGVVHFCSMDVIALIYAMRVCERGGGVATDFRGQDAPIALPAWSDTPWPAYSLWRRLRIRFGRIELRATPSPQGP